MNESKKHSPKEWEKWRHSGAVGSISTPIRESPSAFVKRMLDPLERVVNIRGNNGRSSINRYVWIQGEGSEPAKKILVSVFSQADLPTLFSMHESPTRNRPSISLDDGRTVRSFDHPEEACSMGIWIDKKASRPGEFFLVSNGKLYEDAGKFIGNINPLPESGIIPFTRIFPNRAAKVIKLAAQAVSSFHGH